MVSELRPISILRLPGKILEHLIHDDYYEHLTAENLLSNNQFGFQPNRSTSDAIAQLIYYIGMGFNNSLCTVATFIDFAKAFDTLNHSVLIEKIKNTGMADHSIRWFQSYLEGRKQRTKVNTSTRGNLY